MFDVEEDISLLVEDIAGVRLTHVRVVHEVPGIVRIANIAKVMSRAGRGTQVNEHRDQLVHDRGTSLAKMGKVKKKQSKQTPGKPTLSDM